MQFVVNYFVFSCDFQLNIFDSVQFGSRKLAKIFAHTYERHSMLICRVYHFCHAVGNVHSYVTYAQI